MVLAGVDGVPREQGLDGLGVPLGNPMALGVFVHDIEVALVIVAAEQHDGAMGVTVVHGGKPFDRVGLPESSQAGEFFQKLLSLRNDAPGSRTGPEVERVESVPAKPRPPAPAGSSPMR